jgi:PERQ amino acid-rich with GYF domain-containing protein
VLTFLPAEELLNSLMGFPMDPEVIGDTIYTCSTTMDGRRFAEEFIRRKNAAKGGVVIEAGSGNGGTGGWNEVAKGKTVTQPVKEGPETNASFKVVAGKKKGRRG